MRVLEIVAGYFSVQGEFLELDLITQTIFGEQYTS
jgi:hypothetical protein